MGAITRSAVIIRPLRPYLAWAKRDDTTDIAEQVFEDLRRAPHVYLLPEYGDADPGPISRARVAIRCTSRMIRVAHRNILATTPRITKLDNLNGLRAE